MPHETKEQTRKRNVEAILAAAENAFAEHGYRGSSISMIATLANVPKSNVTYYFSSKEKLYRQVLNTIFLLWLGAGDEIVKENDPSFALKHYIHDKMDLARVRPNGSKVWANEIVHGAPFINDYLQTTLAEWVEQRGKVLKHWMDKGLMRRSDPKYVFYMIWATTQHYADFNHQIETLNNQKPLSDEQWEAAKQTVSSTLLNGLLLEKEQS